MLHLPKATLPHLTSIPVALRIKCVRVDQGTVQLAMQLLDNQGELLVEWSMQILQEGMATELSPLWATPNGNQGNGTWDVELSFDPDDVELTPQTPKPE